LPLLPKAVTEEDTTPVVDITVGVTEAERAITAEPPTTAEPPIAEERPVVEEPVITPRWHTMVPLLTEVRRLARVWP